MVKPYDKKKSKLRNLIQLVNEIGIIMVIVYLIRIFIKHGIPNPLKGIYGFDPRRVMKPSGNIVLGWMSHWGA